MPIAAGSIQLDRMYTSGGRDSGWSKFTVGWMLCLTYFHFSIMGGRSYDQRRERNPHSRSTPRSYRDPRNLSAADGPRGEGGGADSPPIAHRSRKGIDVSAVARLLESLAMTLGYGGGKMDIVQEDGSISHKQQSRYITTAALLATSASFLPRPPRSPHSTWKHGGNDRCSSPKCPLRFRAWESGRRSSASTGERESGTPPGG